MSSLLEHTRFEVGKLFYIDGTAPGMVWESKMLPDYFLKGPDCYYNSQGLFLFCKALVAC